MSSYQHETELWDKAVCRKLCAIPRKPRSKKRPKHVIVHYDKGIVVTVYSDRCEFYHMNDKEIN